jgi:hypothetical protein
VSRRYEKLAYETTDALIEAAAEEWGVDAGSLVEVPLAMLVTIGGDEALDMRRRGVIEQDFAQAMRDGRALPPIVVSWDVVDGGERVAVIQDGMHRVAGALIVGADAILALVEQN